MKKYLERYKKGETISPVLLIAGFGAELPVIIAEGYHRVSACWQLDEKTTVAVRLNPV